MLYEVITWAPDHEVRRIPVAAGQNNAAVAKDHLFGDQAVADRDRAAGQPDRRAHRIVDEGTVANAVDRTLVIGADIV